MRKAAAALAQWGATVTKAKDQEGGISGGMDTAAARSAFQAFIWRR